MERSFVESVGMQDIIIIKACSLAMEAHNSAAPNFLLDKIHNSSHAIFAFPGSWSTDDWVSRKPFGASKIDQTLFPSLRSVGKGDTAIVNDSFLGQFKIYLSDSNLQQEVRKAMAENKHIVFTGHSSGGPIAILATIWLLEHCKQNQNSQCTTSCVTFGSPLIGDRVFGHALRREHWSHHFIHFVNRYDIVPRVSLAPLSSMEREFPLILCFFNPKSCYHRQEIVGRSQESAGFFGSVMRNAASVTSHAACLSMESTNPLLESVIRFVELSPYTPFGTYIFCTGSGKMVTVINPDAVLQMFFHCLQLSPEEDITDVAYKSLQEHLLYEFTMQGNLERQTVVYLDNLDQIPVTANSVDNDEKRLTNIALDELGLSTRARICLQAAGVLQKQKAQNQAKIESNFSKIEEGLSMLERYRTTCEVLEIGYYDAFKFQRKHDDFNANVKRLELAGMWDEIIEMLWKYNLPDDFEARKQCVELGTKYRRLVEPLDIANYYRHNKNDDTGPYMVKGRPGRYKYTQKWLEYERGTAAGTCSESCFWAEVEELCADGDNKRSFEEVAERVLRLENKLGQWLSRGDIGRDVYLEESTFVKWWTTLPEQHKAGSSIRALVDKEGRNLPSLI
ncbi:hypothetical protein IFM89_000754 [Coptis chinensis]|uniref:Enhanced disease susceptibility 1 n=1 Tax=Coptis chinensis TaxID=261450 RepID=A0A835ISW9_9MAGN|nr:hypothetical protein IFM89_000754 [Coptis chinensis]